MEPITLRVPQELANELTEEADEQGYRSRSEYVRRILRNRSEHNACSDRTHSDYVSREEFEALRERVDAVEDQMQRGAEARDFADRSSAGQPSGSDAEDRVPELVQWARANQPVSREDVLKWVAPRVDIKPDSWWKRHGREKLKEHGAEFVRNVGWRFPIDE